MRIYRLPGHLFLHAFFGLDDLGQRAYVGKVNMDQHSPDYYVEESMGQSIADTKR